MYSDKDLNRSNGVNLYAYEVNGTQVTNFMKLLDLEKEVKPEGAKIIKAFVNGGRF